MTKLFLSSVRLIYRDKQALFWALAFPVIFAVVFGLFDFTRRPEVSVALAGSRSSPMVKALDEGLRKARTFKVYRASETTARRDLREGRVNVALVVPPAPAAPPAAQAPAAAPAPAAAGTPTAPAGAQGSSGARPPAGAKLPAGARPPAGAADAAKAAESPGDAAKTAEGAAEAAKAAAAAAPPSQKIQFVFSGRNADRNQYATSAIGQIVDAANLKLAGVAQPQYVVDPQPVSAKTVEYFDFLLPGLVGMGVMNFAITGMAVALARFREQRILRRVLATPLRPVKFLVAQVSARLLLSVVQAAIILAVGVYLLGAHLYGNVGWVFLLVMAANLIFLNIGFAVAGRTKTADAAQGVGAFVAIPMMFLSGVFFPTESLPGAVETVVRFLPLTPLIEAMRNVVLDGASLAGSGPQLGILGCWIVVSFCLAAFSFRMRDA